MGGANCFYQPAYLMACTPSCICIGKIPPEDDANTLWIWREEKGRKGKPDRSMDYGVGKESGES